MAGTAASRTDLLRKEALFTRVLELWRNGEGSHSTFCIAAELKMDEREVCHLLEEADGRAASLAGGER